MVLQQNTPPFTDHVYRVKGRAKQIQFKAILLINQALELLPKRSRGGTRDQAYKLKLLNQYWGNSSYSGRVYLLVFSLFNP